MKAHLNRYISVVQSLLTATITLVGINSAQAQNSADLIPLSPGSYSGENILNTPLDSTNSLQPKNPQTFIVPNRSPATTSVAYRVIIPSDNLALFDQAKAIEPSAFIQLIDGQQIIQVGLFSTEALALQQIARFQAVGMPVRIQQANSSNIPAVIPQTFLSSPIIPTIVTPIDRSSVSVPPATYSPPMSLPPTGLSVGNSSIDSTATNTSSNASSNKGFYVVIPMVAVEASYMQSQLNQVGIPSQYILFRDRPFGLHYAIGTFSKRSEAERLSDIIRDRTKFDARVYYER